jgi:hypothetical protein
MLDDRDSSYEISPLNRIKDEYPFLMHFRLACSAAPLRSRYCTARVSKRSLNIKVENAVIIEIAGEP